MSTNAPPDGHARYLATASFGALDGLRALSIVAVVWHHAAEPHTTILGGRGFLGVDLFFVISGFLIVTLLLRERDRKGAISLRQFYIRRALRIFPLYYGWLLALGLFSVLAGGASVAPIRDLPFAALYLGNWVELSGFLAITWSLAAEEQFYLAWPPLERALPRGVVPVVIVAAIFASVFLPALWPTAPSMLTTIGFTPILLGVGLAHVLHSPRGHAAVARVVDHIVVVVVVVVAAVALLALGPADLRGGPRLGLQVLAVVGLAACVVREETPWNRWLRLRVFTFIGMLSYGLYLLHMPAHHVVVKLGAALGIDAPVARFGATLALGLVLAWLSHRFFERRFLALKSRFAP